MTTATAIDMNAWRGRTDALDGAAGRRWHQVVRAVAPGVPRGLAVVGFACDAGVKRNHGRVGAAAGPQALRKQLANLAWHGGSADTLYDAGDVDCTDEDLESAQARFAARVTELLRAGHRVTGLGGGHEIAWASYQGLAGALAEDDARLRGLGIVNFDAHFDLRRSEASGQGSSGTPFLQIAEARAASHLPFRYLCVGIGEPANTPALFNRARSLGTRYVLDVDTGSSETESMLAEFVAGCEAIYCTFCLDVLPASAAPGVSAPAGLGLAPQRAIALLRFLRKLCREGGRDKLACADVAELNPAHDAPDLRTARVAARVAYELSV
jgi:formiminoglutamase